MKRVSIFLITAALILGMMGCEPAPDSSPPTGAPLPYALGISSTSGGSVSVIVNEEETVIGPGETEIISDIPAGTDVDLTASPAVGYEFVQWVGEPVDGVTNSETTINMQGNYEITVHFGLIPPPPPTYELTMEADPEIGGTAIDETNAGPYVEGAQVSVKAEANEGYLFVNWTAPEGEFDNAYEPQTIFVMPAQNITATANFELMPPTYELIMAADPEVGGTATDETSACPYVEGAKISIKAEANQGYFFVNWTAPEGEFDNADESETIFTMPAQNITVTANFAVESMVAAGGYHTVGLQSDGNVVATGLDDDGQCNVDDWQNIVQVAAGGYHTVGLKYDGTVVATGLDDGQCDVDDWQNIVQVAAGEYHTVGLKYDGTVLAVGDDTYGQCDVGEWTNIIQVAAGYKHTVGLKSDGSVVAVGRDTENQCDVDEWADITQVAAGQYHTVGLESDDSVVAVGLTLFKQCDVGDWADITQVTAGDLHTVGLKDDGSMVAVGDNGSDQCDVGEWADIFQVAAGYRYTVGLKANGSVVAVGRSTEGQCDVSDWMLN